jgi:hypothetical protein
MLFEGRAPLDPQGLILTSTEAARQKAARRRKARRARDAAARLLAVRRACGKDG